MQKKGGVVQSKGGRVVVGAVIQVYLAGTNTPATIFADKAGTEPITQLVTDNEGEFAFYAPNGRYDIKTVINGRVDGQSADELLFDPSDVVDDSATRLDALDAQVESVSDSIVTLNSSNSGLNGRVETLESMAQDFDTAHGTSIVFGTWPDGTTAPVSALGEEEGAAKIGHGSSTVGATLDMLAGSSGAANVGFIQSEAGAVGRKAQDKLRETVTVKDFGGVGDGVTDDTAAVLAAVATGKLVRLDGFFKISTSIATLTAGLIGDGPQHSGLVCNGVHAITIPANAGISRRAMRLENFSIDSSGNTCDDKFAIYAPGVASGAATSYNIGLNIANLEIGRYGRMGGGIYLKDFFRVNAQNIGMTDVSQMIRLVGSVVQTKFRNITSNNDSAATVLPRYGISIESATYSDIGVAGAENARFIDCAAIRCERGINHQIGSDIEFVNFDTEADTYGAFLNAPCTMRGGILAPGIAATAWTGIYRGVNIATPDDATIIDGVDVKTLRAPATPASSYGIDLGDGVSPVYGVVIRNVRVRGAVGSIKTAVRGRDCRDLTMETNFIRTATLTGDGIDVWGKRLMIRDTRMSGGTIKVQDQGDVDAYGDITFNQAVLSFTPTRPNQWNLMFNENAVPTRRFLHTLTASATFDPPSLADGAANAVNVTCLGASVGDVALASIDVGARTMFLSAHVSVADTVRVNLMNKDTSTWDLGSGTVRVVVHKLT